MARTISSPGAPSSDALNCFSSPAPPPKQHAPQPHRHLLYLSQAAPVDDPASASTAMQHDQHHAAAGSDDDDDASRRAANHAALAAADADADSATTRTGGGGTRKIVLKRPPSSTSGPSAAGSGGARSNGTDVGDAGTDAKGETDDDDDDEDTHVELGRSLDAREPDGEDEDEHDPADEHDDGDDQSMKDPTVASSDDGESEIEVASRPPAPPPASNARRPRRRSSSRHADAWAGTDDDDDDSGADDKAVDTVTFAQPGASLRVSRSGRISKPPAHVLQSVQSLAFLDDEQDDDEQPQQRPKGKSKGKASAANFISKNEDQPEWAAAADEHNGGRRELRERPSRAKSGGLQPSSNRPLRSTRQPSASLRAQAPTRSALKPPATVPKTIITASRRGLRSTGPAIDPDILRAADQELPAGFDGSDGVLVGGQAGQEDGKEGELMEYEDGDGEFNAEEIADETDEEEEDEEEEDEEDEEDHPIRNPNQRQTRGATSSSGRSTRNSRKHVAFSDADEDDESSSTNKRSLRERKTRPNYQLIPPPPAASPRKKKTAAEAYGTVVGGGRRAGATGYNRIPWGASGKKLGEYMGLQDPADDDSDDDYAAAKGAAGAGGGLFGAGAGGGLLNPAMPMDMAGGPSNMGKVGDATLSDADPLGVNTNITFDDVGGLDQHIQQLKEMVSLPLLYPEVFQQFSVTPPRGVLFHGPPGTGKTLVARALAASCSSTGTKISFFMRKGADCLSKWVGEAERQLRLLFEEAKACQPSIIFFDEMDGLAPVRSSKQDQIHASIVSTLLALMDGMDGRGQVIIIGATNRPDAVDPALRRPGRFDREFFFPLPNKTARRKILEINTKTWEPPMAPVLLDNLADVTKGYGGADLRALCTEASLNAIQRRYPQIYKTNERLLLQPDSIHVQAKDFMVSVKNLIPSSARSTASAAAPLPAHLVPLLADALERTTAAIDRALPPAKRRSVLEDAEWETDDGAEGSYEKELRLQEFEQARVYRPRLVLHGAEGLGQSYLASAVLHHLEGFHVQSLDLATLLGDSTRTLEAALVQLFVEAKRHKPAVLFIPSLTQWVHTVTETARATFKSLLDSLAPSDPVLLLAVVDGTVADIPRDVKAWFGHSKDNRVALTLPGHAQRAEFFSSVLQLVRTPPSELPDGAPKRRRVLEVLPIAPPPPPRKPTAAELAVQEENDGRLRENLKWRLGQVLVQLKSKHKRFTKPVEEEFELYLEYRKEVLEDHEAAANSHDPIALSDDDGHSTYAPDKEPLRKVPPLPVDINLDIIHSRLYYDHYLTVEAFLADMHLFVDNAHLDAGHTERVLKTQQLLNHAQLLVDQSCEAQFQHECRRMAERERDRRRARREAAEQAPPGTAAAKGKGKESDGSSAPPEPRGSRFSHRTRGVPAEVLAPPAEPSLKRSRGVSLDASAALVNGAISIDRDDDADAHRDGMDVDGVPPSKKARGAADADVASVNGLHESTSLDSNTSTVLVLESPPKRSVGVAMDGASAVASTSALAVQTTPRPAATFGRSMSIQDLCSPTEASTSAAGASNDVLSLDDLSTPRPSRIGVDALVSPSGRTSPQKSPGAALHAPFAIGIPSSSPEMFGQAAPTPSEAEEGAVVLPPPLFELPLAALANLERTISERTAAFTVEQLEQLRALLSDAIWRRRADWDRASLVDELGAAVAGFVRSVEGDDDDW